MGKDFREQSKAGEAYLHPPLAVLPVAKADCHARLVSADGSPVWPYVTAAERDSLERTAELFGVPAAETPANAASRRLPPTREGTVVAACEDAREAAQLYAHLTGRQTSATGETNRIGSCGQADVVVAPWRLLTPGFLDQLYQDSAMAPGLITGGTPAGLIAQALIRAAALALAGSGRGTWIDVRPFSDHGQIEADGRRVLGQRTHPDELRRALGQSGDLLTIFTVGDGIDAGLGPLTLCPMIGQLPEPAESVSTPVCVTSGFCHRLQRPLPHETHMDHLVAPEAMAAQVLVLHACWGIQPAGSLFDPRWGYGHRLANHERLGAVLTTWRLTMGSAADTEPLARAVASGVRLGEAVARFNAAPSSQRTGQRMCLLGDPDMRIAARPTESALPAPALSPSRSYRRQLQFLDAYLATITPTARSRRELAKARSKVRACLTDSWGGFAGDIQTADAMRRALVLFLCRQGTIPAYHWVDFADPVKSGPARSGCPACHQAIAEAKLRLRIDGSGARTLSFCPRCGLIGDRPAGTARLGLTVEAGGVRLHGAKLRQPWAAALLVRPLVGKPTFKTWPADRHGRPVPTMPVKLDGAGQILLLMIEGASLSMARTQHGYAAPAASLPSAREPA